MSALAQAFDSGNGKTLHDENCVRCHNASIYTRPDREIKNYPLLRKRVAQCEVMAELMWFDEEVDAVTVYLNNAFYHFNTKK